MDSKFRDQLAARLEQPDESPFVAYGTAGFRGKAEQIKHIFFKLGLISGLRCLCVEANIGIMITASHNPVQDNGVKLIEPSGEMLESDWERIVEKFCNTNQPDELVRQLESLIDKYNIRMDLKSRKPKVLLAMDTRPSSAQLAGLVEQGLENFMSYLDYHHYGLMTTPAMHFLVAESNKSDRGSDEPSIVSYYDKLINGLVCFFDSKPQGQNYAPADLIVDCANGVGYQTIRHLQQSAPLVQHLPFKLINTGEGTLNESCGADYVKSSQFPPLGADETGKRYAALDGDADRLVYFYLELNDCGGTRLRLLDGDKIMALYAKFIKDSLSSQFNQELSVGIVQTAYANGSSTRYFENVIKIDVVFTDTGVKNLHREAVKYDIGLYFEANGHGTIWLSQKAREIIDSRGDTCCLKRLIGMLNNYTGDAISDLLIVESILRYYDWDVKQWDSLYADVANSLIKVEIPDRNVIETTNAGRTCIKPAGLQSVIDSIVTEYGQMARCFVRASGTENVVRIYAEAEDQQRADELARRVGEKVKLTC